MAITDVDPQTVQMVYRRYSFNDLTTALIGQRLDVAGGDIDYDYDELTLNFNATAAYPADPIGLAYQLPHTWVRGTWFTPHVHWLQNASTAPNWLVGYRLVRNGEAVPSTWTLTAVKAPVFTYPGSGTILQICTFESIPLPDLSWSDTVDIKLYRDSSNASGLFSGADSHVGDAPVKYFDIHIPVRDRGTLGEWSDG